MSAHLPLNSSAQAKAQAERERAAQAEKEAAREERHLNPEVLPPATVTEGTEKSVRKKSDTSLAVFDTGANGWRSFVVRNIQVLKYN